MDTDGSYFKIHLQLVFCKIKCTVKKDLDDFANSLTKEIVDSDLNKNKCNRVLGFFLNITMLNVNLSLKKKLSKNS